MDLIYLKDAPLFCFIIQNETYYDFAQFDTHYGFTSNNESIQSKYVKIVTDYQNDFTIKDWRHTIFDCYKIFSKHKRFLPYDSLEE